MCAMHAPVHAPGACMHAGGKSHPLDDWRSPVACARPTFRSPPIVRPIGPSRSPSPLPTPPAACFAGFCAGVAGCVFASDEVSLVRGAWARTTTTRERALVEHSLQRWCCAETRWAPPGTLDASIVLGVEGKTVLERTEGWMSVGARLPRVQLRLRVCGLPARQLHYNYTAPAPIQPARRPT